MARTSLSKSALSAQSRNLKTYERFLPSLDLKRKQLMAERNKSLEIEQDIVREMAELRRRVEKQLPMLANEHYKLKDVAVLRGVTVEQENLLGTTLPRLVGVDIQTLEYGYLTKPHWVDMLVELMSRMLELHAALAVQRRRNELLDQAVRKVTQRVNLFDKVLIPRTRQQIRTIRIHLADAERAAVVRSKIAKAKRARGGLA
jgi:V/A-type H+-transporting ATPase subunit D